jgi:hydrogenase nickel incorporation protein HypA/HybF
MLKCPKCGKLFEKQLLKYDCPDCGVEGNPTDSGNEVELNGVELA